MNHSDFEAKLEAIDDMISLCKEDLSMEWDVITQRMLNDLVEEYDRLIEWGQIAFGY